MGNNKIDSKTILTGRIYPALQSCVRNRYLLIIGIFSFYSFILTSETPTIRDNQNQIQWFGTIALFSLIVLNSANYFYNSIEAYKIEEDRDSIDCKTKISKNKIELCFIILSTAILISALCAI